MLCLCSNVALATIPAAFEYQNKPIDALCFTDFSNDSKDIKLRDCGAAKEHYLIAGQNADLIAKGFIGYDWKSSAEDLSQGYSYYKFFQAGPDKYWLYTVSSGGGSGSFSALNLVERKNPEVMEIESIAGGDRCNGGLSNVINSSDTLTFDVNLTAYDVIGLAKQDITSIKAYDDLAACAACCVATATYELKPKGLPLLKNVDFGNQSKISEMPDQGAYQQCFNQLFTQYVSAGKNKLEQNQIDSFVTEFKQKCAKH